MKKLLFPFFAAALLSMPLATYGADAAAKPGKHFKFYGFIRNYFAYDSRESASGTGDLFYYMPLDRDLNELGEDLNAKSSFRFLALTSRLGVDVGGYSFGKMDLGAKVETDFYCMSGTTAVLRLRQAYLTLGWKDLPFTDSQKASVTLKIGQAWHPMAADQPDVISLATGAPFNAFNRSPQVTMDAGLGRNFTLTASAIYQMQYPSTGPAGSSANYMMYGILPELYASLSYHTGGFLARAGVSLLSIKPRSTGTASVENPDMPGTYMPVETNVSDRMTSLTPFVYLQYKHKLLTVKAKTIYGGAADHLNQVCGYGVVAKHEAAGEDGHWEYAATRTSSSWISASYGKKLQGMLMLGYIKTLGAGKDFTDLTGDSYWMFSKDGGNFKNLASMYRIVPTIVYNFGKFALGIEYELTSAEYGDTIKPNGAVAANGEIVNGVKATTHMITNHRVQMMAKFTF